MLLELLKPELLMQEARIRSTIVVFGGTQIIERDRAEQRLADARDALAAAPQDKTLQRTHSRAEKLLAKVGTTTRPASSRGSCRARVKPTANAIMWS